MAEAEVRRCPVCGGPVEAGASSCGYCASPLFTVRCSSCYALNAAEALHCSGCGHELGLEPLARASDLVCPDCQRPFSGFAGVAGRLSECTGCGGQFVEHALLAELLERREVYRGVPRVLRRENPLDRPVRYLPCPSCTAMMNRKNFGETSGIVVDVCARHGVWFDAGELPRVLAFVQAGGLERARLREAVELDRRERERRVEAALSRPVVPREDVGDWVELGRAGRELLAFIVDTLRGLGR